MLLALTGAILLAVLATTPPRPVGSDAPARSFSAARAMADVRVVAGAPRPTGSVANAAVRTYLARRLRALGLRVEEQRGTLDARGRERLARWSGAPATPPIVNLVATLAGRDPGAPAILLMAHHDSVWGSPGAADDAAGVAAILEVVRALRGDGVPARSLIVLMTDAEELGLQGARTFFARPHPPIGAIVNLETRGGGGRATMFETGAASGGMMTLFAAHVRRPVATSLSTFIYQRLPNSTDYTIAKRRGVPGYNFAFIGRPALYHSPLATPERLDQGALQDLGRQVLDLTRGLLNAATLPGPAADRTFYDAYGIALVSYPTALGWLLLAVACAGYAIAGRGQARIGPIARGAGAIVVLILLAAVLLYLVNGVSGGWGRVNYYDRLAAIPRLQVQALLVCVGAALLVHRWLAGSVATAIGAALPLLVLGVVAQALAPTASYVIVVPLMLGGIALAIARWSRAGGTAALVAAAALGVGYMLGFGFFVMQAVGPGLPMIAALPLAISMVLLLPLVPAAASPQWSRRSAAVLLSVALGIALWVRLDPIAPTVPAYRETR
ncbi:Peptidase family M28 [Sphingomonas guangdongensis]|uniref:Peptidase family M28 n=1 Tax=Sphingomonas guangdongensis TaxID=1141890 RepID=A0A285R184_9SPHN|nr:M20/M25/M40 family metallo-hydrolase [Sphingomonas guangdongensis]SOB87880.1 Peptidase family M28 [Sphingomonas guangdongensis]